MQASSSARDLSLPDSSPDMPSTPDVTPSALDLAQAAQASAEGVADALTVSERQYRRLFEAARDGILLLDSEHGRITDANPFMTELLGYSHNSPPGNRLEALRGDREGQHSIRINDQWRVCFVWRDAKPENAAAEAGEETQASGSADAVEIADYH